MALAERDKDNTVRRYTERYAQFGYSEEALGWTKKRQPIRFDVLSSIADLRGKMILDIGCGFGDLNTTLTAKYGNDYTYIGVDVVDALIGKACELFSAPHICFLKGEFLKTTIEAEVDVAISSGIFNHRFEETDSYGFIEATMEKAFALCREGFAFDFLSDKVDYELPHTFHASPERILEMAYRLSRNVVLRNDYMPFEFALYVYKDDGFKPEEAVFSRYQSLRNQAR
ncbi:MAG: class I SAM-dependent methyltransferase [Candidatus Hydrogenedentes bacterium]|nr:class I SAM-dependent methyltransferase [Candidatus Hydrogenedentota bacterium]